MREDQHGWGGGPTESEDAMTEPVPFEVYEEGIYLHGTKAVLVPGEMLTPSRPSNFREDAPLRHVYVTQTMHAAAWGAQLALGDAEPRVYVVEPTGELEDDPNVTDQRLPGNPTRSYRTLAPVRVIRELEDWPRHSEESVAAMREGLAALREKGADGIIE
jgi:rifampin ADP-ribosylating transferase